MALGGDLQDVSVESDVAQAFYVPSMSQVSGQTLLSNCRLTQSSHVGDVCAGRVGCARRSSDHDAFQALKLTMSANKNDFTELFSLLTIGS